jgi:hypothetical protein
MAIVSVVTALGGIVVSVRCGTGMASDRTEGTPCGVSEACSFLSEQARLAVLNLSPLLSGVGMEERSCAL